MDKFSRYEGMVKSSRPNLREIRDKRPVVRELDRGWRLIHSSVKLFLSKPMVPCALH